jgi:hypothetical protein
MPIDEKRSDAHGVAGITEKDTYCQGQNMGDRALSLFFDAWEKHDKPTY